MSGQLNFMAARITTQIKLILSLKDLSPPLSQRRIILRWSCGGEVSRFDLMLTSDKSDVARDKGSYKIAALPDSPLRKRRADRWLSMMTREKINWTDAQWRSAPRRPAVCTRGWNSSKATAWSGHSSSNRHLPRETFACATCGRPGDARGFLNSHLKKKKQEESFPRLQHGLTAGIAVVTMTSSVRCFICDNGLPRRASRPPERAYPARSFANTDGRLTVVRRSN